MSRDNTLSSGMDKEVTLPQVEVKGKREHYSKRNNPAVELMKSLRDAAEMTSPLNQPFYSNRAYNRLIIGLDGISDSVGGNGKMKFINQYIDTLATTGRPMLPLSIKERLSKHYYRRQPRTHKELIYGLRSQGVDEIFDQTNVSTMIAELIRPINIFDNNISLLGTKIVSPLALIGPDFYRYYIGDTVSIGDGVECGTLEFAPRNHNSPGFIGRIYYDIADSVKVISRVDMRINSAANINYIKMLQLSQQFARGVNGCRLLTRERLTLSLSPFDIDKGIIVESDTYYTGHDFAEPTDTDILDRPNETYQTGDAFLHDNEFWQNNMPRSLADDDTGTDVTGLLAGLRQSTMYRVVEKLAAIIVSGYIPTSSNSKVNIGPVNSILSFNPIEGARFKLGAYTTPALNNRLSAGGYVAYGTKDRSLKYKAEAQYSFIDRKKYNREYPINAIKVSYSDELSRPGQIYSFTTPDNIFLSPHWTSDTMAMRERKVEMNYTIEVPHDLSMSVSATTSRFDPKANIDFTTYSGETFSHINQSAMSITLRWAPGEKYYQTQTQRIPANVDGTVISVTQTYGPNRFAGNRFSYNMTEFALRHRQWLTPVGHFDAVLKGGAVWSQSPFTTLFVPNTNLSYTVQPESFSLLRPYEIIVDRFLSLNFTYHFDGFLLNLLPFNRWLKLREIASANLFWGHLSHNNTPSTDNRLPLLPDVTRHLNATPYTEVSIGLDNILSLFRVDYVWRLTYRDNPGVPLSGIRIGFRLAF